MSSICRPKYRRDHYGDKHAHAFWGKADCGLILSSILPWEFKTKEAGITKGGWVCKGLRARVVVPPGLSR